MCAYPTCRSIARNVAVPGEAETTTKLPERRNVNVPIKYGENDDTKEPRPPAGFAAECCVLCKYLIISIVVEHFHKEALMKSKKRIVCHACKPIMA